MSVQALEALQGTLASIDDAEVKAPNIPVSVYLQEGHDLLTLLAISGDEGSPNTVRQRVLSVGLEANQLDALERALGALRHSQSLWINLRDQNKPSTQKVLEREGQNLRAEQQSAVQWSLRHNAKALRTLEAIKDGDGIEDLIQDLFDLATLIEQHQGAFESDTTFDASAHITQGRELAQSIRDNLSDQRLDRTQRQAKALRDRAYTHAHSLLREIRAAGRRAYRTEASMLHHFGSAHLRKTQRKHRI